MPKENLTKILNELRDLQRKILKTENAVTARVFWRKAKELEKKALVALNDEVEKNFFQEEVEKIILPVGFLGGLLGEKQLVKLFQCCLKDIFSFSEETLLSSLKNCLLVIPVDLRDEVKEELKKILEQSEVILTTPKLLLKGKIVLPTVSNWLKDYHLYLRGDESNDLEKAKYFVVSDNIKKISEEERKLVKNLAKVYSYLNSSSLEPTGHEEDYPVIEEKDGEGKLEMFTEGKLTPIDSKNKHLANVYASLEEGEGDSEQAVSAAEEKDKEELKQEIKALENMLANYSPQSLEYQAIQEEIAKLKQKYAS